MECTRGLALSLVGILSMKGILHWLLCHNVAIFLLLYVITGILFKGPIFGIETQTVSEHKVSEHKVEVTDSSAELTEPVVVPASEKAAQPSVLETETLPEDQFSGVIPSSRMPPGVIEMPVAEDAQSVVNDRLPALVTATSDIDSNKLNFRPVELAAEEVQPELDEDILQKARKAYWNDDLQRARNLYQAFIGLYPDNPDGYGELGNLLSTIGDLDEASQMYQKAAELLLSQGQTEQAAQLLEVLDSIKDIQNMPE